MPRIFRDVREWLSECRSLIRQDLDNLILLTGAEGVGKSTLMYQLGKALDPQFGISNIGFSIGEYMEIARNMPRGRVAVSDEFLANKRKAMHRQTVELLDFLQECRGLNLHHIICFPHQDLLDKAVLDYRVRWVVHVPRRGLFVVREKVKFYGPGGAEQTAWRDVGSWFYKPNSGPEWEEYKRAKHAHMMRPRGDESKSEETEVSESFDLEHLRSLPARYEEAARSVRRQLI